METKHNSYNPYFNYLIIFVIILAAGLRFYNLNNRGIFDYDEAWYLLEGKTLYDTLQFTFQKGKIEDINQKGLKHYLKERGTVPITSFKPGHTLLVFLGLIFFGLHDYSSFIISAILGTLTVYFVYRLTTRIYGPKVGLLASLILALSPFHIGYSRAGYAQANALFFVVLGIFLWYSKNLKNPPSKTRLFFSGCAIGFSFTCHFNLFCIPLLFLAYEIFYIYKNREFFSTISSRLKRLSALCIGFASPPLLFELPSRLLRLIGYLPEEQQTYFEQFFYRGQLAKKLYFSFSGASAFIEKLLISEGILIIFGIVISIGFIILKFRTTKFEDKMILFLLLIPAIPWTILSVGLPPLYRTFSVLTLPVVILAAVGLIRLSDWVSKQLPFTHRLILPFIFILVAANGAYHVKDLLVFKSTYKEATDIWIKYIEKKGGRIYFFPGSVWPIWYFYLSARYDKLSSELQELVDFYPKEKELMPPNGDFDAFDIKRYLRALSVDRPEILDYEEELQKNFDPIVRIFNPISELPLAYGEVGGQNFKTIWGKLKNFPSSRYIQIFDLRLESSYSSQTNPNLPGSPIHKIPSK